jgi:hypothetical protein
VEKKFPDAKKVVACIFFSKLICPTITSPFKCVLDETEAEPAGFSEQAAKGLASLANLLECFASEQEIKDSPSSEVANESIHKQHTAVIALINELAVL